MSDAEGTKPPQTPKANSEPPNTSDSMASKPEKLGTPERESLKTPESERASTSRASSSHGRQTPSGSRRRKRGGPPPDAHPVTFTVTISMAVPTVLDDDQRDIIALMKKKGRIIEAPRAQTYYHLEYILVPRASPDGFPVRTGSAMSQGRYEEVLEEGMRVDMVTYGLFAKVYPERGDARIIRTWQEGDRTWIVWDHTHTLNISRDTLQKLADHTIQVRIWDQKEKCSTRARFDRPKAFQLPQPKPGEAIDEAGGVKKKALRESKRYQKVHHKRTQVDRPLPGQMPIPEFKLPQVKEPSSRTGGTTADKKQGSPRPGGKSSPSNAPVSSVIDGPPTELLATSVPEAQLDHDKRSFSRLGELAGEKTPDSGTRSPKVSAKSGGDVEKPKSGTAGSRQTRRSEKNVTTSAKSTASRAGTEPQETTTVSPEGSPKQRASRASSKVAETQQTSRQSSGHRSTSRRSESASPRRSPSRNGSRKASSREPRSRNSSRVGSQAASQGVSQAGSRTASRANSQAGSRKASAADHTTRTSAGKKPRRTEMEKAQYEMEMKTGKCVLEVRVAALFAGQKMLCERLHVLPTGIEDLIVSVIINDALLSPEQRQDLNPLILTIGAATDMPASPISFEDLHSKCEPAYVQYTLLGMQPHQTMGRKQANSLYWNDMKVILAGCIEPSVLREFLNGPPLEMELHDRDRREAAKELRATLFGEDLEDEKIANVGTVASRRTNYSAFETRNMRPWDPFGVAKFDLSELLLSATHLYLKAPIHSCRIPDYISRENTKIGGKVVGVSGAVDAPGSSPLPMGHYMESNSYLKIKVDVGYPLVKPAEVAAKPYLKTTNECPFGRIVYRFPYNDTRLLHKLYRLVSQMNADALGLSNMPPHVLESALSTYKLSQEQQHAIDLNIVTGFQVMDSQWHIFILEGLRDKAISTIWQKIPQTENKDMLVLHNSDLSFSKRLYGTLDVDLTRIKLHEPLDVIIKQPLLYVRDMVPRPCLQALSCLHQMLDSSLLQHAVRNNLFPSAEAVVSMSREFGVPLTAADFEELKEKQFSETLTRTSEKETEESLRESLEKMYPEASRQWEPIDNYNVEYIQHLDEKDEPADHVMRNIEAVQRVSDANRLHREATRVDRLAVDTQTAHNYSTQFLNSTDLAHAHLRQLMKETPGQLYTYCQEYNSGTLLPVNEREQRAIDVAADNRKRVCARDWRFPGVKPTVDCNIHPKKPGTPRREELEEPFEDNRLHANVLEPTLQRDRWSWTERNRDFNIWKKPHGLFDPSLPITIHESGVKLQQERNAEKLKDQRSWESKLVVSDPSFQVGRVGLRSELNERGSKSNNQIDKLTGILKDEPMKVALSRVPMSLKPIPPLSVVNYPGVDTAARAEGKHLPPAHRGPETTSGYGPGEFDDRSWVLEKNRIPLYNYQHTQFTASRGSDFNAQHRQRYTLAKRAIKPLSDSERRINLFRPEIGPHPGDYFRQLTAPELSSWPQPPKYPIAKIEMIKAHGTSLSADSGLGLSRDCTSLTSPNQSELIV